MMNIGVARQMLARCQTLAGTGRWREAPEAVERLLDRVDKLARAEKRRRVRIGLIDAVIAFQKARCCAALCLLYSTRDSLAWAEGLWAAREESARMARHWHAGLAKALNEAEMALNRARAALEA